MYEYRRVPVDASSTWNVLPATAAIMPFTYAGDPMIGCSVWWTQATVPVAGSSAETDPPAPRPFCTLRPPAKYSIPFAEMPDASEPSPHVGHAPPMATCRCHTGPAAR